MLVTADNILQVVSPGLKGKNNSHKTGPKKSTGPKGRDIIEENFFAGG
jgi:hypothetical protein